MPFPGVLPCPALSGGSRRWQQVQGAARPHLANHSFPLVSAEQPQRRRGSPDAKARDALSTVGTPAWRPKQGWEGSETRQKPSREVEGAGTEPTLVRTLCGDVPRQDGPHPGQIPLP